MTDAANEVCRCECGHYEWQHFLGRTCLACKLFNWACPAFVLEVPVQAEDAKEPTK